MLKIENNTISLTRGDSMIVTIDLKNNCGEAWVPEPGDSVRFVMKSPQALDSEPLIEKSISTIDMALRLVPADTKQLAVGSYVYDVEVTFADGFVDTVINKETFKVLAEVD